MNRTDEKDSPIASDAWSSHGITGIKFGEPNKAVVLAMIHQLAVASTACQAACPPKMWPTGARASAHQDLEWQNGLGRPAKL